MFRKILSIFLLISYVKSEDHIKNPIQENRMIGIDTLRDMEIGKDTIINRNMKLGKRNFGKNSRDVNNEEGEPDWSYSSFPKEVRTHVEQFKLNMSQCLKEVQDSEKKAVQRLSPRTDSPVHGDCLIACVLKRNEVIKNGKIHKENLLLLVNKFFAKNTQLMKKLEKQLDQCIDSSIRNNDECKMAAELNDCTNRIMVNNKHKIVKKGIVATAGKKMSSTSLVHCLRATEMDII